MYGLHKSIHTFLYCVCMCVCRQKIGNFKTEPPGLFRGRGDHPKQGRIKVGVLDTARLFHSPDLD